MELNVPPNSTYAIDAMREPEALEMLNSILQKWQYCNDQATSDLLKRLMYLPLAIQQASAYMEKTRATTATYLQHYLESDAEQTKLLVADFEDRWRYSIDMQPIATTWLISFQHLEKKYPLATEYLKFICFLAEKGIPISLLPHGETKEAKDDAIEVLERYAFISVREQRDTFDIDQLVRLVTRAWVRRKWKLQYTKVIQQLAKVYPFPGHRNRKTWKEYMPHARVALDDHEQCMDWKAEADLLYVVADSYDELGKYAEAEKMHRRALELRKSALGPEHPDTLGIMNNLGLVLHSQEKYEEAGNMHRKTLELRKLVLGPGNPDTLDSMNNLGLVLHSQEKYQEARDMHYQTLGLRKSILGPEHPSALSSMNNLALVLDSQGNYEEAEEVHRQTLEMRKLVLGSNHRQTLSSMNNLALILDSRGKYEEAEEVYRQTLELRKSILGPANPDTVDSMNNLANVFHMEGKYEEAEAMHRRTLELAKSALGPEHPSTVTSVNNLALVLESQRKYKEAEETHQQALELYQSVLGPVHPSTVTSMNNLDRVLRCRRKFGETEEM